MLQPFRCKPIYKEKIWGGRWFQEYLGRELPNDQPIGESWELACRTDAMSEIQDGPFAGHTLLELLQTHPEEFLGRRVVQMGTDPFPLLVKFLDAEDRLSVQVHPDNFYAGQVKPGELGKTEMWYILDAEPGAMLIMGVEEGITKETFSQAIQQGELHKYLTKVPVQAGDAFYIPSGTVHAVMEGIRLAEIQQNSDTTYRVYDWNRKGLDGELRQLHIREALDVIDFKRTGVQPDPGVTLEGEGWKNRFLTVCPYFAVCEMQIQRYDEKINSDRFEVWIVLEGSGQMETEVGVQSLQSGETWVIPASTGQVHVSGDLKILRTFIPDPKMLVNELVDQGYEQTVLFEQIGGLKEIFD